MKKIFLFLAVLIIAGCSKNNPTPTVTNNTGTTNTVTPAPAPTQTLTTIVYSCYGQVTPYEVIYYTESNNKQQLIQDSISTNAYTFTVTVYLPKDSNWEASVSYVTSSSIIAAKTNDSLVITAQSGNKSATSFYAAHNGVVNPNSYYPASPEVALQTKNLK